MDFRDTVFISVAEHLSFSKAAGDLNISQPAVTRHIKELEERYHTNLFERKGNKIYLTKAGESVYNAFKQIAAQYRELDFDIGQMQNSIIGEFNIGASSTISQYVIPRIIASFHKRYPKIQIFLRNGNSFEMEQALQENQVDMALVENCSSQPGIRYKNFMDDELIVVTGANSVYAKREELRKDELIKTPIVLREQGSGTLEVIKEALKRQKIEFERLNTLIHLGSTESIKNFLSDFDGLAIVSEKTVTTELYLKTLVKLKVTGFTIPRKFRMAFRYGHKSRQVELFENFLQGYNF
ncbi:LysR substrate-binding domain-containing protein [Marinilabilia salmonicolor]|jgi:DNA-binding transcriptional LysR family regulator|uniref:DNA-binding transcriptional LysR family regulator n=1 Tax=Marinilabilia salmonicolor TaxID=989 RepID=A0A2T0XMA1_9BACT|nr:LysR substrate-binding domain-containing protein [Marinilabilia salmonicolor]PRZ00057.1 DNA-binding transcriptional LysR family regulator [Marinilabilia salmonicolor]RCW38684.1 DNA-binding transcriptional LysR family regulator [Marinilabilia salmonicolor]